MLRTLTTLFAGSLVAATAQAAEPPIGPLPSLPPASDPAQAAALVELGQMLYFDSRLSGDGSTSCASCHDPAYGFGDGSELGRGYPGTKHWRNSQTIVNSAFIQGGLHWDGSVPSLLHQVPGAMGTPFGANINVALAEERLRQVPDYRVRFSSIWNSEPNIEHIAEAIAAFEASLVSGDSPYDRYLAGDLQALSPEATRGMDIFANKGNCASCHNGPLGTDEQFHNTSVPPNPDLFNDPLRHVTYRVAMRGFGLAPEVYEQFDRDPGLFAATQNESDLGVFRTPPLRYLTHTAPYMHNGSFYTLEEVVEFYDAGGTEDAFGTKSDQIKPLRLTNQEKRDLVAFLESMSGTEIDVARPDLPDYEVTKPVAVAELEPAIRQGFSPQQAPTSSGVEVTSAGLTINAGAPQPAAEGDARYVIVQNGETLGDIALREYGDVIRFREIYEANKALISDPNSLLPGTRLVLP